LPIEPREVLRLDGALAVGGLDPAHRAQWWEVRSDGQVGPLASPPSPPAALDPARMVASALARSFGPRPLVAAVEDGWPLSDGTALVARDGALARVRLSDGGFVGGVTDAFALKPARCHPVSLARQGEPGAFGFVCGEPRGRTLVYRWDAPGSRMVELARFDGPREVLAFGNGALAVRGPCTPNVGDDPRGGDRAWCLMRATGGWSEMRLRGDDVDRVRLVVLSDGRVALVRPPRAGDLSTGRLTVTDGAGTTHLPLRMPPLRDDVSKALRWGVWMDGFEERRPGVLGGWVDAAGSVLGLEISLDGETRIGEYIRDAGAPMVSGRWAFGWTASRQGFGTTDGGMTWTKELEPEPIVAPNVARERACGPVGCVLAGWVRVGWGRQEGAPLPEPPAPHASHPERTPPGLSLDCEPVGGRPPGPTPIVPQHANKPGASAAASPRAGAFPPRLTWGAVSEFPSFSGRPGPALGAGVVGVSVEASSSLERIARAAPLANVYVWGPSTGEWEQLGRWQIRWQWPWGGWADARSSATSAAPWSGPDAARRALGIGVPGIATAWTLAAGDDPDHAVLIARHSTGAPSTEVILLESDRAPIQVRRAGDDPFPDVQAATRVGGRWYLATGQGAAEPAASVVWRIDGSVAHEIGRVPRVGIDAPAAPRLARRTDGRALGWVVDGQSAANRGVALWIVSLDLENGTIGDPEPLAPGDLSDRTVSPCTGDEGGWELDMAYPGPMQMNIGAAWTGVLETPMARMRLSRDRACVDRVLGTVESDSPAARVALLGSLHFASPHQSTDNRAIDAGVALGRTRFSLHCWRR
jgi:hypothetical protein